MATKPLFGLTPEMITEDFINEMVQGYEVPKMTRKRLKLLSVLIRVNGINKKNEYGEFYHTNAYLMDIVGFKSEEKLINALCWMVNMGVITRRSTFGLKPTLYKITLKKLEESECSHTNKRSRKGRISSKERDVDGYYSAKVKKNQLKEKIKKEKENEFAAEVAKLRREVEEMRKLVDMMQGKQVSESTEGESSLREQFFSKSSQVELRQADEKVQGEANPQGGNNKCVSNHNLNEVTTKSQSDPHFYQDSVIHSSESDRASVNTKGKGGRKSKKAQASHNLNSEGDNTLSEADKELRKVKLEIGRLLHKLNENTYMPQDVADLYSYDNKNMLTTKQHQMFYAIRRKRSFKSIHEFSWWVMGQRQEREEFWIREIGDISGMTKRGLINKIKDVMLDFWVLVAKRYILFDTDCDKFNNEVMRWQYEAVFNKVIERAQMAC